MGDSKTVDFNARSRLQRDGQDVVQSIGVNWESNKTAVVICDVWSRHFCDSASRRCAEMAPRINAFVSELRARGVLIIHCPSTGMDHYKNTPMRLRAQTAPRVETDVPLFEWCWHDTNREGALPIDDSDDGCDCQPRCPLDMNRMNYRQAAAIKMADEDAVADSTEAFYLMKQHGITNVIILGVHTNVCVLGRSFGIRQLVHQRLNVALVRDLTDAAYNPRRKPFVVHTRGTELMVEHIERYWCPSFPSSDILGGEPFRFSDVKM